MESELSPTSEEIAQRLSYVEFAEEDARRVIALRALLEPQIPRLLDSFFAHLSAFPECRALFESAATIDRARHLELEHLAAMLRGRYDGAYVTERVSLGKLYSAAGLGVSLFLGAYHQMMRALGAVIMTSLKEDGFVSFMSLKKVAFFDLGLIVDVLVAERERTIGQQQDAIRELSTPVLQLRDRLLMLPIIGLIDTYRARLLTENLLAAIRANRARVVVMDVTGVSAVDTKVANHLLQTVAASRLMGAEVIITGLSAEVAQTLVTLGVNLAGLKTVGDLQGGIEDAEKLLGLKISQTEAA